MKETLKEQVEKMYADLCVRQAMLDKNIEGYIDDGNLMDAAINKIKRNTLTLVISGLNEIIN